MKFWLSFTQALKPTNTNGVEEVSNFESVDQMTLHSDEITSGIKASTQRRTSHAGEFDHFEHQSSATHDLHEDLADKFKNPKFRSLKDDQHANAEEEKCTEHLN